MLVGKARRCAHREAGAHGNFDFATSVGTESGSSARDGNLDGAISVGAVEAVGSFAASEITTTGPRASHLLLARRRQHLGPTRTPPLFFTSTS